MRQRILAGEDLLGLRIYDAHAHFGANGYASSVFVYSSSNERALEHMRALGIAKMAVSGMEAIVHDYEAGNESIMESCAAHPDKLDAYLFYDAHNPEGSLRQIERHCRNPRFIGVKIHPRDNRSSLAGDAYDALYDFAAEKAIPVLCHTWATEPENDPALFWPVLRRYPKLKLILGHMGGTYTGCMTSLALSRAYKNVYCDINGSLYSKIWLEELVKRAPFEKFIFSTDQVFNDPRIVLGRVLLSGLSDTQKQKLLCDNFEALMERKLL